MPIMECSIEHALIKFYINHYMHAKMHRGAVITFAKAMQSESFNWVEHKSQSIKWWNRLGFYIKFAFFSINLKKKEKEK